MKTLLLAAAGFAVLTATAFGQGQTVRIATEGAYPPFNFINEAGAPAGYEIDLAQAICEEAGLTCEFVINDWDSIIPNLLAGNYDLIMAGMSITEERQQTIDFTDDYYPPDPSKFAGMAGAGLDLANLSGARIGAQGNTLQANYITETFGQNNEIVAFETADQALADLAAGNLDLIFTDGTFLDPVVASSNGSIEFVGEDVLLGEGIAAGIRKEDSDLKSSIDAALTTLKQNGTVDELIAQHFSGAGPFYSN